MSLPTPSPSSRPVDGFDLRVRRPRPRTAVLAIRGEIDVRTVPRITDRLDELGAPGTTQLIVDLGGVTFMGAAGAAVLLDARGPRSVPPGGPVPALHVVGLAGNRAVHRVLGILGVVPLFSTFPDVDACLRHLARVEGGY